MPTVKAMARQEETTPVAARSASAGAVPEWTDVMVPNYGTPNLTLVRGQGAWVEATDGRRYLDLLAGVAVNILGHAHPAIVEAVQEQIATLGHTSNLYGNIPALRLAACLQHLSYGHKVLWQNSGTEANEAALKLVRRHAHATDRPDGVVLAFHNSFHGRSTGSLALTGQPKYHDRFAPLPGQILHLPFNDPESLEAAFAANEVVGVFAEVVQGEGGVRPMTPETASLLPRLARDHDALLVVDEVQTGIGRTGRFWAHEHFRWKPDVITSAKGLGGGLPLGACLVRPDLAALLGPGSHGCTFGGNPVACAAGLAVLDTVEKDGLVARAEQLGGKLADDLAAAGVPSRGMGLLQGVPLAGPTAPRVVEAMQAAGYLVGQAGPDVVRMAPPLIVEERDLLGAVPGLVRAIMD